MTLLRGWFWLLLCAVTPSLVACGGDDDDDDDSIPIEQVPGELAQVYCGVIEPCLGALGDTFLNGADCEDTFTAQFSDEQLPRWQAAIDAGTVIYHADKAGTCFDDFARIGCALDSARPPASCDEAIEGTVALGGECNAGIECVGIAYCKFDNACPGTCAALEPADGACDDDDNCQDGLSCQDGHCLAPGGEGDACGRDGDPDCHFNLICLGADSDTGTPGSCRAIDDVLIGAEGDPCDLDAGELCQEGLSCVVDSLDIPNQSATLLCARPVASGAACKFGIPDPCPDTEMCDANPFAGQVDGTCVSLPDDGEPCSDIPFGVNCSPGLECIGDICTRIGRIGDPCTSDDGCYSGACDGDTCTPPALCAYDP